MYCESLVNLLPVPLLWNLIVSVLSYKVMSFLFEFLCCVCECLVLGVKPCDPNAVLTPRFHTFTLHGCWHFTVAWTMWWADRVWGGLWVLFIEQLSILLRCCLIFLPLVFLILCADFVFIFVKAKYAYLTLFHCLLYLLYLFVFPLIW